MTVSSRDLRLDFFRGLALLFIFLDHIPDNLVSYFTLGNVVFSDAAEIFVFLSGYTAALVFGLFGFFLAFSVKRAAAFIIFGLFAYAALWALGHLGVATDWRGLDEVAHDEAQADGRGQAEKGLDDGGPDQGGGEFWIHGASGGSGRTRAGFGRREPRAAFLTQSAAVGKENLGPARARARPVRPPCPAARA